MSSPVLRKPAEGDSQNMPTSSSSKLLGVLPSKEVINKLQLVRETLNCLICKSLMYDAVTISPCAHKFCASCLSKWLSEKNTCPLCREAVACISADHLVRSLIEQISPSHARTRPTTPTENLSQLNNLTPVPEEYQPFSPPAFLQRSFDENTTNVSESGLLASFSPEIASNTQNEFARRSLIIVEEELRLALTAMEEGNAELVFTEL